MPKKNKPSLLLLADKVARTLDADLLLYNAPVERHLDQRVIELCSDMRRRTNVGLFLVTSGGDADAAYRIATCLQNKYKKVTLFVSGYCKSAGTLVALGAHEIAISDHGENGPLDVQMARKDELVSSESGLTATTALRSLNEEAFRTFEDFLLKITEKAGPMLTTKTVADIAVKMTTGLFSHVYQQIDPMHIGEAARGLEIARAYGIRLVEHSKNLNGDQVGNLEHLISHYPSHGFIIDYREAKKIFKNVRYFTADELALMKYLGTIGRWPVRRQEDQYVGFISTQVGKQGKAKGGQANANTRQQKSRSASKPGTGKRAATAATGTGPSIVAELPAVASGKQP